MYVFMCHMYTCMYIWIYMCVCIYVCMYMCMYVCEYVYISWIKFVVWYMYLHYDKKRTKYK